MPTPSTLLAEASSSPFSWSGSLRHLLGLTFVVIMMPGCGGDSGPPKYDVNGTITVGGEPVEEGTITLEPLDGKGASASSKIKDGKYHLKIVPGKKQVVIHAPKVVKEVPARPGEADSPMIQVTQDLADPKYNDESQLAYNVEPKSQTKDFSLDKPDPNVKRNPGTPKKAHR